MAKRMLVDATRTEETRVAVVNGNKLEELDFEIASRKHLKGNIYLAKVTRVEPSLQAAFVEYGGNRHGFLAFSEIHPDYYRIPVADREALLAQERAFNDRNDEFGDGDDEGGRGRRGRRSRGRSDDDAARHETAESATPDGTSENDVPEGDSPEGTAPGDASTASADTGAPPAGGAADGPGNQVEYRAADYYAQQRSEPLRDSDGPAPSPDASVGAGEPAPVEELARAAEPAEVDTAAEVVEDAGFEPPMETVPAGETPVEDVGGNVGGDVGGDEADDVQRRRPRPLRSYKIQEVIKRRQILLIQVVKEERGNKGAALTTYLSLPGRYCVLMPNTGRGGGISRKITNPQDRKRLKEMLADLDLPEGMAVILRTAGMERTKQEIKRDLEYLLRLWDSIRELTLKSTAPALIYEEANLIKRSIRDLYANDLDDVLVEGEDGYRAAKDFMRMLMPSHTKKVQPYRDETIPLFFRYQVESQIDAMHSPLVQLKSGGYVVINQTEALVAIDVNSGRSTKERNIEETAFKTNLEAADEVARQLRLRDLAGLIVIDFIDMEDARNNASVEKRLKEAMRNDRARIQLGRISPFGLLELSRQRLRPSLIETNFEKCPHCAGTGMVRSLESAALFVLRAIEEEGIRKRSSEITIHVASAIALYILNQKRDALTDVERRYGFRVFLFGDDTLTPPEYRLERIKARPANEEAAPSINIDRIRAETDRVLEREAAEEDEEEEEEEPEQGEGDAEAAESMAEPEAAASAEERGDRRRRRRRRRRNGEEGAEQRADARVDETVTEAVSDGETAGEAEIEAEEDIGGEDEEAGEQEEGGFDDGNGQRRKRRRGKRGGRRRSRGRQEFETQDEADAALAQDSGEEPWEEAGQQQPEPPVPAAPASDAVPLFGHPPDLDDIFGDLEDLAGPTEANQPAPAQQTAPTPVEPEATEPEAAEPPATEPGIAEPPAAETPTVEAPEVEAPEVEAPAAAQADAGEQVEAAPPPAAAEEAPAAKPKRARAPRKKKADAATEAATTAEPAAPETGTRKAPAKAKTTRTRKKKTEAAPTEAASAKTASTETAPAEEAPAKPKRVRAPRKKKTEAAAAEPVAEVSANTGPQPAGTTEPQAEPQAEPVASPVDQAASGAAEGGQPEQAPEAPPAPDHTDDAGNPAVEIVNVPPTAPRRGWWRRG